MIVLTLTSVTGSECSVEIALDDAGGHAGLWQDLLSEKTYVPQKGRLCLTMGPYDVLWLMPRT